jgi:hypothetical protein
MRVPGNRQSAKRDRTPDVLTADELKALPVMETLSNGCHPFPMLLTPNGDNWVQKSSFQRISSDQFRQLRLALWMFPKLGRNISVGHDSA